MTTAITDDEIAHAIDARGTTDIYGVEDVRRVLDGVQQSFEDYWSEHMDVLEDGGLELVHANRDVLVFADHTGHGWNEEMSALDVDGELARVAKTATHDAANRLCDYSWSTADPFVIERPAGFDRGQHFVEAVVNSLIDRGLTPGQAWAYYGVHVAGNSRNAWAERGGYGDHSAVSQAVRKAEEKLP